MAEIYGKHPGATSDRAKWTGIAIAVAVLVVLLIALALWRG